MKYLFLLSTLFASFNKISLAQDIPYGFDKTDYNFRPLLNDAHRIMKILRIKIRDSTSKDGELIAIINRNKQHYLDAEFGVLKGHEVPSFQDPKRYYLHSYLRLSVILNKILTNKIDTTFKCYLKAKSIVVHELTHYLQSSYDINPITPTNAKEFIDYIKQQQEFEAYSAEGYYFLENFDKNILNHIMHLKVSLHRKCELLIDGVFKIQFPKAQLIFLPEKK